MMKMLLLCSVLALIGLSVADPVHLPADVLPAPGECGVEKSSGTHAGDETGLGESPWNCLLEYMKPNNISAAHCLCVLINHKYVLTGATCVIGKSLPSTWHPYRVVLGEWDRNTDSDCINGECAPPVQKIAISKISPHPEFSPSSRNSANDIALIRLETPVTYSDFVKPICLPLATSLRTKTYAGETLLVTGWGKKDSGSDSFRKLKAQLKGVDSDACAKIYTNRSVEITDSHICAIGDGAKVPCRGDSGAPLMAIDNSDPQHPSKYLVGMSSFGPTPCGNSDFPDVFTNVAKYVDWVQATMKD